MSVNASYAPARQRSLSDRTGEPVGRHPRSGERKAGTYTFRLPAGQAGSAVSTCTDAQQVSYVIVDVDGAVQ